MAETSEALLKTRRVHIVRRMSMETYMVRVYPGPLSVELEFTSIEAEKSTSALEIVTVAVAKLGLGNPDNYELAEVLCTGGQLCKERRLEPIENPVRIQLLWPTIINSEMEKGLGVTGYRYYLRKKDRDNVNRTTSWHEYKELNPVDTFLTSFLKTPTDHKEYPDLCNLPDLNERTLLDNIKARYHNRNIYTYVGSILIAVNPFKFFPIYNPKYVKMYQNKRLGELPPHIFAIADAAFYTMLRTKSNQCIVISGESGSGKTESTNLLLHHLTALSQKGAHGSGVEQTILGAGPVLEAFGNAKTVHNNNSSRFGKFIQVNYKENGMVHGAIVEKYLLEKSRIVSQARNERNYHVFYYLLAGADEEERSALCLAKPEEYLYIKQSANYPLEGVDEEHEFARLKQSMELVGFPALTQRRVFAVLSAVLQLGNIQFRKKGDQHHDESVTVQNKQSVEIISGLLKVKEKTLTEALTQKKTSAGGETFVINYKMDDALATRDAMAKCLYGALFDWIVLKVNQALLAKRHNSDHQGNSIGVLDIFGFEDFTINSFEQFCINYANEHLQYYFNQHIFKIEQEEYNKEGIQWKNIEFIDNTGCLELFAKRPHGLFCLLDEECNFPGATNETLLSKFNHHHKGKAYYEVPQLKEGAFKVYHYAGKVKYSIKDFREKNCDQMRMDIVNVLKSSSLTFVRELMGIDPVAVLRWSIVRTLLKSVFAFISEGKKFRKRGGFKSSPQGKPRRHSDYIMPELVASENLLKEPHAHPGIFHFNPYFRKGRLSPLHDQPLVACPIDFESEVSSDPDEDEIFIRSFEYFTDDNGDMVLTSPLETFMPESEARVLRRATRIILRNKSFRPKPKPPTMLRDIKTLKQIASRTMYGSGAKSGTRKQQPASVSAQFQWSLNRLMATLNQANPFFIRCIKSNPEKAPCVFDDAMVLRQLRYTGMLATVRIRQSGYNYRLTFEEFIHMYKILLPRGLVSSKEDVTSFVQDMRLNTENYQIGITKVFLRESEKMKLDEALHRAIMKRVIKIQRWFKTILERQTFLKRRSACIVMQACIRQYIHRKSFLQACQEKEAAIMIQKCFKCWFHRRKYLMFLGHIIIIQSFCRGYLARKAYRVLRDEHRRKLREEEEEEQLRQQRLDDSHSNNSDEGILRGSSGEELDKKNYEISRDSDGSSGIHEDSDTEDRSTLSRRHSDQPEIKIQTAKETEDDYLRHSRSSNRVSDLAKAFQEGEGSPSSPDRPIVINRLRPSKIDNLEACLQAQLHKKDSPTSPVSPSGEFVRHIESPLRRAKKGFKTMMGGNRRGKKDAQEETEETPELPHTAPHRPESISVQGPASSETRQSSPRFGKSRLPLDSDHADRNNQIPKGRKKRLRKGVVEEKKTNLANQGKDWNLSGTSLWQYPENLIIRDVGELQHLDDFINKKLIDYNKKCERDTIFDAVFKKSLKLFHQDMQSVISLEKQKVEEDVHKPYRELLAQFAHILQAEVEAKKTNADFPITMGVNAFRGFLDEYTNKYHKEKKKKDDKKVEVKTQKKDSKKKDIIEHLGHKFNQVQFGSFTFCEYCSSNIWIREKGCVCQVCKYACHKKCMSKTTEKCRGAQDSVTVCSKSVFGTPLVNLVSENDKVPQLISRLIDLIETHGLYTVGIYRKSGANAKVKLLRQNINAGKEDLTNIDIAEYNIHTLCALLKKFFMELPNPLLTFDLYDDFIRATEIHDEKERIQSLYAVVTKLPPAHYNMFERLIFHLARVAFHEANNKMSANGLAIIFAPCLLRTNKNLQAQESLSQVPKQTTVVTHFIQEHLMKIKADLQDICTLDTAADAANDRLLVVRESLRKSPKTIKKRSSSEASVPRGEPLVEEQMDHYQAEEKALASHLRSIKQEKENLRSNLQTLECRQHSSDDEVLTDERDDSNYDTADDFDAEEFALTFELPVSPPNELHHPTKRRATLPPRRPPSKFKQARLSNGHIEKSDSCPGLDDMDGYCENTKLQVPNDSSYLTIPGICCPDEENDDDDEIMV